MTIEHIGISVAEPIKMAEWYQNHLGCTIKFVKGTDDDGMVFIVDSAGETILELFHNPVVDTLASVQNHPIQVHLAFKSEDIESDSARLCLAGAEFILREDMPEIEQTLILHRDPWGNIVQLVKRKAERFLK